MRVFVTGATGFIGSAVVDELTGAGHQVLGLARSEESAIALEVAGADVQLGSLEDLDSLCSGADQTDGVVHTAYIHDFSRMDVAAQTDRGAIEALATTLEGSGRPLVITTGIGNLRPGRLVTEEDLSDPDAPGHPRHTAEHLARSFADRGVRASIIRPGPSVHGEGDHGFVPRLIEIARAKGVSGYVGDGSNRWSAVHRLDAARQYRLALEHGQAGSVFHAIGEQGIPTRQIAEVITQHLNVPAVSIAPEDAAEHFGWLGAFFALDIPASSALTQERLGWTPTHLGLIEDLEAGHYFSEAVASAS